MKKALALILALIMVFSVFAACGNNETQSPEGTLPPEGDTMQNDPSSPSGDDVEGDKEANESVVTGDAILPPETPGITTTPGTTTPGITTPGTTTPGTTTPGTTSPGTTTPGTTTPGTTTPGTTTPGTTTPGTTTPSKNDGTVNILVFGDGIVTSNNFGDLLLKFASADGVDANMYCLTVDTTGNTVTEGSTATHFNLYELYTFVDEDGNSSTAYKTASVKGESAKSTYKRLFHPLSEGIIDYALISVGRDRVYFTKTHSYDMGNKKALKKLYADYFADGKNGKMVLLAPPAYDDGSVVFNTPFFANAQTFTQRSGISTYAQHSAAIKKLAEEMRDYAGLGSGDAIAYACSAFDYFKANHANSGIDLYTDDHADLTIAGTYYMTCVVYAQMFGKSTVGMEVYGYLDEDTAKALQDIAHRFVFGTDPSTVRRSTNYSETHPAVDSMDPRKLPSAGASFTKETYPKYYDELLAMAIPFYARGSWLQYDNIHNSNTYKGLLRRRVDVAPEQASPQNNAFLDCSSFIYSVFDHGFGYNFENKTDTTQMIKITDCRVFRWQNNDNTQTPEATAEKFLEILQPGDVIVVTGHAMLYLGNDKLIHSTSGGAHASGGSANYNVAIGQDMREMNGCILYVSMTEELLNPSGGHFAFGGSYAEVVILRPFDLGLKPTAEATNRFNNMQGIVAYKTTTAPEGITVNPGDTVSITYHIRNDNKSSMTVSITDKLPTGLTFVSGDGNFTNNNGTLTGEVTVSPAKEVTLSYTVTVGASVAKGTTINLNSGSVNGISMPDTPIYVGKTLTAADQAKLVSAVKSADASSDLSLVTSSYKTALGATLPFNENPFTYFFKPSADKKSATMSKVSIVPTKMFGGKALQDLDRTFYVDAERLIAGDIIFVSDSVTGNSCKLYIYLGDGILATTQNGKYNELSKAQSFTVMDSLFGGCQYFCVARPSMGF